MIIHPGRPDNQQNTSSISDDVTLRVGLGSIRLTLTE
jgi:hypothetical protein